jgi:hypothetical protein
MAGVWTMDELVQRVARSLAAEYSGAPNGRVRDLPDRRAIRWYTTIGLVDRPLGMRGRTALYGRRHLLQIVAVKRRQAQGHTLAAIQAELHGARDDVLADVARVPEEVLAGDEPAADLAAQPAPARFWTTAPAPARRPADTAADRSIERLGALDLGGGAILVVPGQPDAEDRAAIATAAGPLLALLADRGLLKFDDGSPS